MPHAAHTDVYEVPDNCRRGRQGRPRLDVDLRLPTEIAGFRIRLENEANDFSRKKIEFVEGGEHRQQSVAHAIAALAYGTESVPPVDFITGPGNAYTQQAKRQLFGIVGIDGLFGPSEVVILDPGETHSI